MDSQPKKKLLIINTAGSPLDTIPPEAELFPIESTTVHGYGAYQKLGFRYAINRGFDFVAVVHGKLHADLLPPVIEDRADAAFAANKRPGIFSRLQRRIVQSDLTGFQSRHRVYSTRALQRIPFDLNTNDSHFETEVAFQLIIAQQRIVEIGVPAPAIPGVSHVWNTAATTLKYAVQSRGIFYDRKFDCAAPGAAGNAHYTLKLGYKSPHSLTLSQIPSGSKVLELGCAGGYVGEKLLGKGCRVSGIDVFPLADGVVLDHFEEADLNNCTLPDARNFDFILMLDVIEHLHDPEVFMERMKAACARNPEVRLIISTGNVAFFIQRALLLFGQFNYGKRGILDRTHTRLFTFGSIGRLLNQSGFEVLGQDGIPAPFPLAFRNRRVSSTLLALNAFLIGLSRTLFSYQIYLVAKPRPSLEYVLLRHGRLKT